jgi:hypothetical protein
MLACIWQRFEMPSIGKDNVLLALGMVLTAVVRVVILVVLAVVVRAVLLAVVRLMEEI